MRWGQEVPLSPAAIAMKGSGQRVLDSCNPEIGLRLSDESGHAG